MKFSSPFKGLSIIWTRSAGHFENDHIKLQRQEHKLKFSVSPWKQNTAKNGKNEGRPIMSPEIEKVEEGQTVGMAEVIPLYPTPTHRRHPSSYGRREDPQAEDDETATLVDHSRRNSTFFNSSKTFPELDDPVEVPNHDEWSDLLLELTLAAAYANIIENTPVMDAMSACSFLSFFALVWWIWATQVLYNIRFRTKDILHRCFAVIQFGVFAAMATFTSNFNILSGLISDDTQTPVNPVEFQLAQTDFNHVFSSKLRQEHLPVLNAKGISLIMALSRLLLLAQYLIVFVYSTTSRFEHHKRYQASIRVHLITLAFSTSAYIAAFAIIGVSHSKGDEIGKIILWFVPIIIEILSYFYVVRLPWHVKYEPDRIRARCSTLFVVVLGEGLNQITGSFKYVVGAVGFTMRGAAIMLSTAVIIIGQLSLYFCNNWETWDRERCNRTLFWFFGHYVYMACLILTLQGVRYLLSFANVYSSIMDLLSMAMTIAKEYILPGGHRSVTMDQFPNARDAFAAIGLPYDRFIDIVNEAMDNGYSNVTSSTKLAQTLIYVACVTFNEFDAFPEQGSELYTEVQQFLDAKFVLPNEVYTLLGKLLSSRLQSAFWFWGVAGGTLIMLAILSMLKQRPVDRYELGSVLTRFMLGVVYLLLSVLTVGHNQPYFSNATTAKNDLKTSKPWQIASMAWLIPSFAITIFLVNCIDLVFGYFAMKQYPIPKSSSFAEEEKA